jgi:DNA-binding IclR family transcriptional regulator
LDSGAIAVPILSRDRVLGCVNVTFTRSAMSPVEAAHQFLAEMRRTAGRIGAAAELAGPEAPVIRTSAVRR